MSGAAQTGGRAEVSPTARSWCADDSSAGPSSSRQDGQAVTGAAPREPVSFLVFSASLRSGSLNTRLALLAAAVIGAHGGEADVASMRDFDAPSYDADVQDSEGFPAGADRFRTRLAACDGFVVCAPEYNASMPGTLKNAIDWVSRYHPQPFNERHGLLMSASPSMSAATVACGRCASPSSTWGPGCTRTCSPSLGPTSPSMARVRSRPTASRQVRGQYRQLHGSVRPPDITRPSSGHG